MTEDRGLKFLRMLSRGAAELGGVQAEFDRMTPSQRRDGIHDAHSMLGLLSSYSQDRALLAEEEQLVANYIEWLCVAECGEDDRAPEWIAQKRKDLFDRYFANSPSGG
jgi:hypothetical protein